MKISIHKKNFLPHLSCAVDFDITDGRVIVIQAENGTGKTSLAREIFRSNKDKVTFLRQEGLDLFYDRSLKQIKKIFLESTTDLLLSDLFEKYWRLFGLDKKEGRFQSSLSGGEEQMLKICLCSFLNKDLIIMDEPSQNLDSAMKFVLSEMIDELHRKKKSLLIIEHDEKWIKTTFSRIKLSIQGSELKVEGTWNI